MHFVGCTTHNQGFACSDLMVANTTAILLYHPNGIFLTLVQIGNAQCLHIQTGERLVRTVILRSHEAVESVVIEFS
ncbi:hypothetical protein Barb7_00805 [Bacteroidales bacterium Barb7]|nr:hypothetical protein Barb7_00805 [Bacteroidales bacterium Barb7]